MTGHTSQSDRSHRRLNETKRRGQKKHKTKNNNMGNNIDEMNYTKYYPNVKEEKHNTNFNVNIKNNSNRDHTLLYELSNEDEISSNYCTNFDYTKTQRYNHSHSVQEWNYELSCNATLKENITDKINALNKLIKSIAFFNKKNHYANHLHGTEYIVEKKNYLIKTLRQIKRRNEVSVFKSHNQKKLNSQKYQDFI